MSRRPNTGGRGRSPRGVRGELGKFYDTHHQELAALDVECDACQQRIVRLFCEKRPEQISDVGHMNDQRLIGADDDLQVLFFACRCGAAPVVHLLAAVQHLIALVDAGKRTGRVSSST